jgi:outer membrane phospholipase A
LDSSPKLYAYVEKSESPDIARYRGHYRFSYGKHDDWPLTANLRKGTHSNAFSAELQGSYPPNRLSAGSSGYPMAQYFTGYGGNRLRDNEREPWTVRLGDAVSR